MTVEPDMESMLASIRQAIDSDLNGLNRSAVAKPSRRVSAVSEIKSPAAPRINSSPSNALQEIEELRNKIGRNRLVNESILAAHKVSTVQEPRAGFAEILSSRSQPAARHETSTAKRPFFSYSDPPEPAPSQEPVLRPSIHDFGAGVELFQSAYRESSPHREVSPAPAYRPGGTGFSRFRNAAPVESEPIGRYDAVPYEADNYYTQPTPRPADEGAFEEEWSIPKEEPVVQATLPIVRPAASKKTDELANDAIMSAQASAASAAAFSQLADTLMARAMGERSIEDMTTELLKGMLRNWLDTNLPAMVERLVREEIERVARRGM